MERGGGLNYDEPFITTFFLCHYMLTAGEVGLHVNTDFLQQSGGGLRLSRVLLNSKNVNYKENGQRSDSPGYFCKVRWSFLEQFTVSRGEFVPNRQSVDMNANRRVDTLRCGIAAYVRQFGHLLDRAEVGATDILVEIYRGSPDTNSILNFRIPLVSRRTGYMLSTDSHLSRYNAWNANKSGVFHLCVPNLRRPPTPSVLAPLLEFVQHHILVGANHIFLGIAFPPGSKEMEMYHQLLHSFVDDGHLTIVSESVHGKKYGFKSGESAGFLGLRFDRGEIKTLFNSMCLYLSKGSAEHVGFWDIDEFFIPSLRHRNIQSAVIEAESIANARRSEGGAHPVCHLTSSSRLHDPLFGAVNDPHGAGPPWLGTRFAGENIERRLSVPRVIARTDVLFNVGAITAGTCRLEPQYTSCFPGTIDKPLDRCISRISSSNTNKSMHNFDERLNADDSVRLDEEQQGSLFHFSTYGGARLAVEGKLKGTPNAYSTRYYPQVLAALKKRHAEAAISLYLNAMDIKTPTPATRPLLRVPPDSPNSTSNIVSKWQRLKSAFSADFYISTATRPLEPFFERDSISKASAAYAKEQERLDNDFFQLPEFSRGDFADLFLSALIERHFDSPRLTLAVFLLNHMYMLKPYIRKNGTPLGLLTIDQKMKSVWKRALKGFASHGIKYSPHTGERIFVGDQKNESFSCRVSFTGYDNVEGNRVQGRFMPNQLTPDPNANNKIDVFRCDLPNIGHSQLRRILESEGELLTVEIYRGEKSMIKFSIPWATRRVGYMLSVPEIASQHDAWKGWRSVYKPQQMSSNSSAGDHSSAPSSVVDRVYMCVPGMESGFDKKSLPLYSEFIEHTLQLGVDHMFIGTTYDWDGPHMKLLLNAYQSYIKQRKISIATQAGNGIDFENGFKGLSIDRDNIKVMFVNMCLYYAKGAADYMAMWDFDEFFVPKLPNTNLMDIINFAEYGSKNNRNLQKFFRTTHPHSDVTKNPVYSAYRDWDNIKSEVGGLADGDGHPFCFIIIDSETINSNGEAVDNIYNPWIGNRFTHGSEKNYLSYKKSILPTRKIFQCSLHLGGACALDGPWSGCDVGEGPDNFCYRNAIDVGFNGPLDTNKITRLNRSKNIDFMFHHSFDEAVVVADARRLSTKTDAIIYHIQAHRQYLLSKRMVYDGGSVNEYTSRFFPRVLKSLQENGIALLQSIPMVEDKHRVALASADKRTVWPMAVGDSFIALGAVMEMTHCRRKAFLVVFYQAPKVPATISCALRIHDHFDTCKADLWIGDTSHIRIARWEITGGVLEEILHNANLETDDLLHVSLEIDTTRSVKFDISVRHRVVGYLTPKQDALAPVFRGDLHDGGVLVCVSSHLFPVDKMHGTMYVEFVEHHIALGVRGVIVATDYAEGSRSYELLLLLLASYISEGTVTVVSTSTIVDISLGVRSSYFTNVMLYYAKGYVEKVLRYNSISELYIPHQDKCVDDILSAIDASSESGGKIEIQADVNDYDKCPSSAILSTISLPPSRILYDTSTTHSLGHKHYDFSMPFFGQRFSLTSESVQNIEAVVISVDSVLYVDNSRDRRMKVALLLKDGETCSGFVALNSQVNAQNNSAAAVYKFVPDEIIAAEVKLFRGNAYREYYFDRTLRGLLKRSIVLPFIFPEELAKRPTKTTASHGGRLDYPEFLENFLKSLDENSWPEFL